MPPKKTASKKQVKSAVKKAVAKKKKTDAIESMESLRVTSDQFRPKTKKRH